MDLAATLKQFQDLCHTNSKNNGWWDEYFTMPEEYRKYFVFTKLFLVHSEVSEGGEGHRKNLRDDHLPHRSMLEVELADAIIRILDLAGALGLDPFGAAIEKVEYNNSRPDHKRENRAKEGGKSV